MLLKIRKQMKIIIKGRTNNYRTLKKIIIGETDKINYIKDKINSCIPYK